MMQSMQEVTQIVGAEYEERYGVSPLDYDRRSWQFRGAGCSADANADQLGAIAIELIGVCPIQFAFVAELRNRSSNTRWWKLSASRFPVGRGVALTIRFWREFRILRPR
jgi:hypothetical protein